VISFATASLEPVHSETVTLDQGLDPSGPQIRWLTSPLPPSSSLTAWIKVLPVLTSTRVLVKVLGRVLE